MKKAAKSAEQRKDPTIYGRKDAPLRNATLIVMKGDTVSDCMHPYPLYAAIIQLETKKRRSSSASRAAASQGGRCAPTALLRYSKCAAAMRRQGDEGETLACRLEPRGGERIEAINRRCGLLGIAHRTGMTSLIDCRQSVKYDGGNLAKSAMILYNKRWNTTE